MSTFKPFFWSLVLIFFLITGCGKKTENTAPIGAKASGVAASGAAIANGLVEVIDSQGQVGFSTQTRTDGTFQIDVSGLSFPLLLKVSSGDGKTFLSAVVNSDELNHSINITPLTHALVARTLGVVDANQAFIQVKNDSLDLSNTLTDSNLSTQETQLNNALKGLITAVDATNSQNYQFRKGELVAGSGSQMDALLDVLKIDLGQSNKIVFKLKSEPSKTFEIPSDKNISISYPTNFDSDKLQNAQSDLEAIKAKIELLNSAMADSSFCDSEANLGDRIDQVYTADYFNRGESLLALKARLWSSNQICKSTPGTKLPKMAYQNMSIDHVDMSKTPALYYVSFDLEVDGAIIKHAIEDVMVDEDPNANGRNFKFLGDQFELNVSALARTDLDQSMDADWNITAASAKRGIQLMTSDADCEKFSGHTLTVSINNGQNISLDCEVNYGRAQLVIASQKYTNGVLFDASSSSDYFLNPKADFYQFSNSEYDALPAEFPVVFTDGLKQISIIVTKPASTMTGVNFNKTPQQLCSETSFEAYGFDIGPDKRVISSTVNYTTQASEVATPEWGSSHIVTLTGSLTTGALPTSIAANTQFLRKFYHFIAVDDFRRSYSRSLNCEKEWLNLTHVYDFDIKDKMFYNLSDSNIPAVHKNIYFFSNLLPGPLGINRWHKNKFAITNSMTSSCDVLIRVKGDNQGKFTLSNCPESPWNNKGLQWLYNPTLSILLITDTSSATPVQYQYSQY